MSLTINGRIYPIATTTRIVVRPPSDNDGWGDEHPEAVGFRLVLPENIGDLTNLTSLDIGYCDVERIPESIGNLRNLEFLYLNDNNLTSLPESIGNLTNLKKLNLYMNDLTSLPETIGNLNNLRNLNLCFNTRLRQLPYSIERLPNLRKIEISETAFSRNMSLNYTSNQLRIY
jgi:Leucine-rich repeat (LRR) protein